MFLEREVVTDLAVRGGFVWKRDNDGWQQVNTLRPLSAFNVPVTIVDHLRVSQPRRSESGKARTATTVIGPRIAKFGVKVDW